MRVWTIATADAAFGPRAAGRLIARVARRVAVQGVVAGIGFSGLGMIAGGGCLTQFRMLEEVIGAAVILNAP